jgi:hypothetical protein
MEVIEVYHVVLDILDARDEVSDDPCIVRYYDS